MAQPTTKVGARSNRGAKPGERRGGRKAGTPNKLTATIKVAIEHAFTEVGGAKYLQRMATEQPVAFMTLLGKVLPTQVDVGLTSINWAEAPIEAVAWVAAQGIEEDATTH